MEGTVRLSGPMRPASSRGSKRHRKPSRTSRSTRGVLWNSDAALAC